MSFDYATPEGCPKTAPHHALYSVVCPKGLLISAFWNHAMVSSLVIADWR
jgi:hypothetical protein